MRRLSNTHGAMLIQVGLSIAMLMGFTVFVVDYGIVWVARAQAQNVADASALSGAVSRAFDEFANPPVTGGMTEQAARLAAAQHEVFAAPVLANSVAVSYDCPTFVTGGGCVQVDVFRNGVNGTSNLPIFFGPLLGVTQHGTRATATAQAQAANAVECMKPWAVMDKWSDAQDSPWTQSSIYAPASGDTYVAPYGTNVTTGFSNKDANGNPVDAGRQMILKMNHPGNQNPTTGQWGAGWALALDLGAPVTPPQGGGGPYYDTIAACTSDVVVVASQNQTCAGGPNPSLGCLAVEPGAMGGGNGGPTFSGVNAILNRDQGAYWNSTANAIAGSSSTTGTSPRVVPLALIDPHHYITQPNANGNNGIVKVVNIVGFFVEGICPNGQNQPAFPIVAAPSGPGACAPGAVIGRLLSFPANLAIGGSAPTAASFGQVIRLVR